ncbi:MAG: T9SS type A sorting domain-containing protein, partial [Prevotellaceae bacterium]|nr:T9SS type A sorting domain-containing protein [Prevotellaceae bacterium]
MKKLYPSAVNAGKLTLIGVLLSGFMLANAAEEPSLVVQAKTGGESVHALSGVRRITFAGGIMSVVQDASQSDYTLADTQKLLFAMRDNNTTGAPNAAADLDIAVYPNPATDELFIMNNEQLIMNNDVQILDIAGKIIYNLQFTIYNS